MLNTIRAIIFDMGGTLLYPDFPFLQQKFSLMGMRLQEDHFYYAVSRAGQEVDLFLQKHPESNDKDRVPVFLTALLNELGFVGAVDSFVTNILLPHHSQNNFWNYCPPAVKFVLQNLHKSYPLAVVSNSDGRVAELLKMQGIEQYFADVIDSAVVGLEKPDPAIFRLSCKNLGQQPEHCLYVGDIYSIDMPGALQIGMQTVLIDATEKKRQDCRVIPSIHNLELILN